MPVVSGFAVSSVNLRGQPREGRRQDDMPQSLRLIPTSLAVREDFPAVEMPSFGKIKVVVREMTRKIVREHFSAVEMPSDDEIREVVREAIEEEPHRDTGKDGPMSVF